MMFEKVNVSSQLYLYKNPRSFLQPVGGSWASWGLTDRCWARENTRKLDKTLRRRAREPLGRSGSLRRHVREPLGRPGTPAQACSRPTLAFEKAVQKKNCLSFNMTLHHFTLVTSLREWIFSGSHQYIFTYIVCIASARLASSQASAMLPSSSFVSTADMCSVSTADIRISIHHSGISIHVDNN